MESPGFRGVGSLILRRVFWISKGMLVFSYGGSSLMGLSSGLIWMLWMTVPSFWASYLPKVTLALLEEEVVPPYTSNITRLERSNPIDNLGEANRIEK